VNSLYRDLGKKKEAPKASLPGCFGLCEFSSQEKQNRRPSYCVAGAAPPRAFILNIKKASDVPALGPSAPQGQCSG